jgi:hypothetical protein
MPRNQELTKVIAGRTIKAVTTEHRKCFILLDDQSSIKIKTAGAAAVSPGSNVKSVYEAKADFKIEFEDGSSMRGPSLPIARVVYHKYAIRGLP